MVLHHQTMSRYQVQALLVQSMEVSSLNKLNSLPVSSRLPGSQKRSVKSARHLVVSANHSSLGPFSTHHSSQPSLSSDLLFPSRKKQLWLPDTSLVPLVSGSPRSPGNSSRRVWEADRGHLSDSCSEDEEPGVEGVTIVSVEAEPLNVPLLSPFVIASSRVDYVHNVAIRMELSNGVVGWGEVPTLPPVTAEDQPAAMQGARLAAAWLQGLPVEDWRGLMEGLREEMDGHKYAAVRSGVEMALVDAVARSLGMPIWKFFGGAADALVTDITVPICAANEAGTLAAEYKQRGFDIIKTKVGGTRPQADIDRLKAIRRNHPECQLIIDANGGYTPDEAMQVLHDLHEEGILPALFEQPVDRDDWAGLAHVSKEARKHYGVPVAADESCRSPADARRIVDDGLANAMNIKLSKTGVLGALEVASIAHASGIDLMIGGMVETRLGMGFAAHLAAGLGGFSWIDLDTPLLLAADPVKGGYEAEGPLYRLGSTPGHGGTLTWPPQDTRNQK